MCHNVQALITMSTEETEQRPVAAGTEMENVVSWPNPFPFPVDQLPSIVTDAFK